MSEFLSRRELMKWSAGTALASTGVLALAQDPQQPRVPTEAPFERDYPAPDFKPSWKKPQLNRTMVQDFVIYAHFDLDMTKKLLDREPLLINGFMDWGAGDWESGLGGASHAPEGPHTRCRGRRIRVSASASWRSLTTRHCC